MRLRRLLRATEPKRSAFTVVALAAASWCCARRGNAFPFYISLAPVVGAAYHSPVRVIARGTLNSFVRNRVDAKHQKTVKAQLNAWYAEVARAEWKSELKSQYSSASIVSAERVVFNIKGNDYRLVVAINYAFQVVLIRWLGTHKEYDKIDVEQVKYDESRYEDPTH